MFHASILGFASWNFWRNAGLELKLQEQVSQSPAKNGCQCEQNPGGVPDNGRCMQDEVGFHRRLLIRELKHCCFASRQPF